MGLPRTSGLFRLTRDAELRYSSQGSAILKLGLASSEKFGDRETQCFMDATVFGKPAEIINQYAGSKGSQIYLHGKLQTEQWADQQTNEKRSKLSMIVEGFDFVSGQRQNTESQPYQMPEPHYEQHQDAQRQAPKHTDYQQKPQPMPENTLPMINIDESDIPF